MFEALIVRIASALKNNRLPYMIIGGQAVLLYGTPRMTKDIDITLGVDIDQLEAVVNAVANAGLDIIPEDFQAFAQETYVLPAKDRTSGIRVDLVFSFTPYERQAIARANTVSFKDATVMFASVEDVIIHKIFAGRPRDLEDVRAIIIKNPTLNREYTRKWLKQFDRSVGQAAFSEIFEDMLKKLNEKV